MAGPKCQFKHAHMLAYKKLLDGDESIMRANYSPKAFKKDILKEQGGVCAICGMKPIWNGKELVFIIDHIDGHASNNRRDDAYVLTVIHSLILISLRTSVENVPTTVTIKMKLITIRIRFDS